MCRIGTPQPRRPTLLYEGRCPFCAWTARVVARLDRHRRLAILPIDDAVSSRLLDGMSNAERHGSWHVVLPDGRVLNGARDASTVLLERLPATAWVARIVSRLRLQPLLEIVDRFFVWARRYLARIVPHGPGPKRFP